LVGEEFFEGAAQFFIAEHPPRAAWLDQFGGEFPDFLRAFPQAKSIVYLGDVAELEWAVNSALHAADVAQLDVAALELLGPRTRAEYGSLPILQSAYLGLLIGRCGLARCSGERR